MNAGGPIPAPPPLPWPDAPARLLRVARALARADEAGTAIGATPSDVAATRDGSRLLRHRGPASAAGAGSGRAAAPLMIVHGLVGAGEIVDLAPRCSLVGDLVALGFAVYSVEWRPQGGRGAGGDALWRALAFEDFALDRLGYFADAVAGLEGRRPAALGVCEGGVFAACLAALEPRALAGVALAVTPIDFHAEPSAPLSRLVRSLGRETLEGLIEVLGGLPGPVMDAAFRRLTPARTLAKHTADLMDANGARAATAQFLRMERWLAARPDHPAAAARQALIDLYHDNALARGAFALDGRRVDLGAITAPVLALYGLRDHLVPPACARAIGALTGGPCREAPIDAGHVGVFVSRRARGLAGRALAEFLTDQTVLDASRV
ncbi:alpha/beta fold hydrolase [Rubrimonas cliftonensis]|uniref:Polyhydroxyalkanoate synthase n=1 Tax=Rubrimonas cliftonensis TaxID=89524 RepID=A0A1H3W7Q1_9RHOB|nr:alpha/beta fold hydrolase [Rubrimonas cliftonensis]SDZ82444.1 polyhydroxyalkanoate synthase [Rubrimonas cliftonensis]